MNESTPPARVVLVVGPPGAGKSTLAAALARETSSALLDRDTLMGPLVTAALALSGDRAVDLDSENGRRMSAAAYEAAEDVAAEVTALGVPVVLVAPYSSRVGAGWTAHLAARTGREPDVVYLRAELNLLAGRLAGRRELRDKVTLENRRRFVSSVVLAPPTGPHLALDASQSPTALLDAALGYLQARSAVLA